MELSSHLQFINQLMTFFPNNTAPLDEACLKLIFLNMMPVKLRTQFAISGQRITDAAFSFDRIPSTTPGAEPPRDAKDSGSARSHSKHLETSSSDRP